MHLFKGLFSPPLPATPKQAIEAFFANPDDNTIKNKMVTQLQNFQKDIISNMESANADGADAYAEYIEQGYKKLNLDFSKIIDSNKVFAEVEKLTGDMVTKASKSTDAAKMIELATLSKVVGGLGSYIHNMLYPSITTDHSP